MPIFNYLAVFRRIHKKRVHLAVIILMPISRGWAQNPYYDVVFKRVKSIRTDFSNRDPEHDSSQALQAHTIAFAAQLFAKPQNVRLADASVR